MTKYTYQTAGTRNKGLGKDPVHYLRKYSNQESVWVRVFLPKNVTDCNARKEARGPPHFNH